MTQTSDTGHLKQRGRITPYELIQDYGFKAPYVTFSGYASHDRRCALSHIALSTASAGQRGAA